MNNLALSALAGSSGSSLVAPEGTEFDGVTDYLSRSSDLVGNVDSKTFTFSCWVYRASTFIRIFNIGNGGTTARRFSVFGGEVPQIIAEDLNSNVVLSVSGGILPLNTWTSLIASCDLADTNKRHFYVNDISISATWTTYSNVLIDFSQADAIYVGAEDTTPDGKGRLSNLYLDYTYRDLSIEANRRLFYSADGKPTATLKALNPILYLPMKDASTAHINEGTGGNFVQNGTLDTASRGANQDNCVASYFDGATDFLSKPTVLTGIANSKQVTLSFVYTPKATLVQRTTIAFGNSTTYTARCIINSNGSVKFTFWNTVGTIILDVTTPSGYVITGKSTLIAISFDLLDTNKRVIKINGTAIVPTWTTYTNDIIYFNTVTPRHFIGCAITANGFAAEVISEFYFDTKYTELSVGDPFWDADTNRPKPVRQVIAETGITPLIAMPLDASNAGKNYGTGGDFTANSAPYVGARGGSEFWARSMSGDGTSGYLKSTNLVGLSASKTITFMCCAYMDGSNTDTIISLQSTGLTPNNFRVLSGANTIPNIDIIGSNSIGTIILNESWVNSMPAITNWATILLSINLETSTITLCINGVVKANTSPTLTNDSLNFNSLNAIYIGAEEMTSIVRQWWQGDLSCMYFTTDYIDFSQEVNRLKFVDGLGYPKDLKAQIDAGVIPNPLIYLPFDDSTNLGKNLGTGGDFSVVGAVTSGSDVLG